MRALEVCTSRCRVRQSASTCAPLPVPAPCCSDGGERHIERCAVQGRPFCALAAVDALVRGGARGECRYVQNPISNQSVSYFPPLLSRLLSSWAKCGAMPDWQRVMLQRGGEPSVAPSSPSSACGCRCAAKGACWAAWRCWTAGRAPSTQARSALLLLQLALLPSDLGPQAPSPSSPPFERRKTYGEKERMKDRKQKTRIIRCSDHLTGMSNLHLPLP